MQDPNDNPKAVEVASAHTDLGGECAATAGVSEIVQEQALASVSHPSAKHALTSRIVSATMPAMIAITAWFLPGFGHLLLRRWQRALAFFVAVGGLAVVGYLMRGNVFAPHSEDPFGTLGFLADASSGIFYLVAHVFEKSGPDVARAMGDYGTRFIAGAGIINMMGVCDAFQVARGHKH
ncbi:MAG TPA: DUF6677 family protein [Candidatus Acidoferrum sp.]|nr:DUF6677 family protein [Candidatus Acidoferrum sp.]